MPKGRSSNPSTDRDGNWYRHSNCQDFIKVSSREDGTSTGVMLNLHGGEKTVSSSPPTSNFSKKSRPQYGKENPFSYHDNRNVIQLTGEYLGDGQDTRNLGRRVTAVDARQHKSDVGSFLKHHGRQMTDSFFHTNYMLSHQRSSLPSVEHRRFPRRLAQPSTGLLQPPTTTTNQFTVESGLLPYSTSSQTLVSSIEPHLKNNTWKYAYHRHKKSEIYPKAWGDRSTVYLPTAKPRRRPIVVERVVRGRTDIPVSN